MKPIKSSFRDLRSLFENSITVHSISEKLECCDAGEDAAVVRKRLEVLDYDVLGVKENKQISGFVERKNLGAGCCRKFLQVFHPSQLIAESTPLIDLLLILRDPPRMFVLEKNKVTSIVTKGDLKKAPVRMLLFGLITLLEMNMQRLIQIHYPNDLWQKFLWPKRLEDAERLLHERQVRDEDIGLIDCLQFLDKRLIVLRSHQIREKIKVRSKTEGELQLKAIEDLRNKLAHAQDLVGGSSWKKVIDLVNSIEILIQHCEEAVASRASKI
jgi:hypothetical protein